MTLRGSARKDRGPSFVAHIDGGSRGNPGPAGYGVRIDDEAGGDPIELYGYLGIATNNIAEYAALLALLERARTLHPASLQIRSDSELLIRQMEGRYRVKDPHLRILHTAARQMIGRLRKVKLEHVPRERIGKPTRWPTGRWTKKDPPGPCRRRSASCPAGPASRASSSLPLSLRGGGDTHSPWP